MIPSLPILPFRREQVPRLCWLIVFLTLPLCTGSLRGECESPAVSTDRSKKVVEERFMDQLNEAFSAAVVSRGLDYSEAEEIIVDAGEEARPTLLRNLDHEDPVGRLIARTLLARLDGGEDAYVSAEGCLEVAEVLAEGSIVGTPPAPAVADGLYFQYQEQSALRAALLLVKRDGYEPWKTRTLLVYLELCKDSSTTEGLLRFAVENTDDELRRLAVKVVRQIDDPDLATRVAYERDRASSRNLAIPAEVTDLAPVPEDTGTAKESGG